LARTSFYWIFIPVFTIMAFLIGSAIGFIAMSGREEPTDGESAGEAAHP
jgi:hypothetical protein